MMPRTEDEITSVTLNPSLMRFWSVVAVLLVLFLVGYHLWQGPLPTPIDAAQTGQAPLDPIAANKQLIEYLYTTVLNNGDFAEADLPFAPGFVYYEAGVPIELQSYQQQIKDQHQAYHDFRYEIEAIVAEDDQVVVRWMAGGTPPQTFTTHPPSGQQHLWRGMTIWQIGEAGIISGWTVYQ